MKKSLLAIFLILVLISGALFSFPVLAENFTELTGKMGKVIEVSSNLNVRSGPGTGYDVVAKITNGTIVNVLGYSYGADTYKWYKINHASFTGYVRGDYISLFDVSPESGDYESTLIKAGFPKSYCEKLSILHSLHPNWTFTPLDTGLSWSTVLASECKVGINCVEKNAKASWKSFEKGAYDWANGTWYSLDSGGWTAASKEIIAYYLDPRNFLDENIFMFLDCSYSESVNVSRDAIKSAMNGTFMNTDAWADGIIAASKYANASAFLLAARLKLEQGSKGNALAWGDYSSRSDFTDSQKTLYKGYYNPFDIGAYAHDGRSAILNGAIYAKNKDWLGLEASLKGGANFVSKSYINVGQNTLYLQKYDVVDGGNGLYSHQYMSNVSAPVSESTPLINAVKAANAYETNLNFIIPVYSNMPDAISPMPTSTGNNNNWLDSLSVVGKSFASPYELYTTEYELSTNSSQIEIVAKPKDNGATVSGAGKITVPYGVSTVTVTVTAPSGVKRDYTITVSNSATDSSDKIFDCPYTMTEKFLLGAPSSTSVSYFKSTFTIKNHDVKFLDASEKTKGDSDIVKTGDILVVDGKKYGVVILGDSNGDGRVTSSDLLKTQKHILSISSISGAYLEAADFNRDGTVNSRDLLTCQKRILGL